MSDPSQTAEMLRGLRLETEERLKRQYDRSLPFADGLFDRWERAKRLGFGEKTSIYDSAAVYGSVSVGENCWIGPNVILDGSGGALEVGSNVSLSAGVHIYTHDTVLWALSGGVLPFRKRPTTIGSNTYIGGQSLIVAGVSIGSRCVIAAGSLVTKDVADGTVVGGVPAIKIGHVEGEGEDIAIVYASGRRVTAQTLQMSATVTKVALASQSDDAEIDGFLAQCSQSMIYYTPAYRDFILAVTKNTDAVTFVARDENGISGLLPAIIQNDSEYGDVVNSLPFFGSHGGAIVGDTVADKKACLDALYDAFADFLDQRKTASVTVVENPFHPLNQDQADRLGCEVVDDRIGQFTALPPACDNWQDELFSILHQKTRNAVRKGQQLGLSFEERNDSEALGWLQKVHEESISAMGGAAKPLSVFDALVKHMPLGETSRLFVGSDAGEPVAGALFLTHGTTVEYFTPVVVDEYRDKQALSALLVECMAQFAREGYTVWNWGGTWRSQEGVYRFKDRWGADRRVYRYFNKIGNLDLLSADRASVAERFKWFYLYKY